MRRALNKNVKRISLLNGVDTFNSIKKEKTLLEKLIKIKLIFYLKGGLKKLKVAINL